MRRVIVSKQLREVRMGPGFTSFGLHDLPGFSLDPFLNLDDFRMSLPTFPPHPHAGFSAVTYMFEDSPGGFINRDSLGDRSRIGPGALHWTQAAHGIMHEEVPEVPGTTCHGLQMFVNLRGSHKTTSPRAFHRDTTAIPVIERDGARIRVLAGRLGEVASIEELLTPILFLDVHLAPHARLELPIEPDWRCFGMSIAGSGLAGPDGTELGPHDAVGFADHGDSVALVAGHHGLEVLIGAGRPIGEPVVVGGPFVMTSHHELAEARARFLRGEMGRLAASF